MEGSLIIKGLAPSLVERGKIKIGEKGRVVKSARGTEFQPPKKLDYFRVTTLERGPDGNYITDSEVHRLYGDQPRELPIRLLYDDIALNFQCRYVCFVGKTMWCAGDGETAWRLVDPSDQQRTQVPCPCGRQDPLYAGQDPCKISARLSCMIDGVERIGGVWVLRTTSYNSTVGILSSLSLIKRITGGPLAGIPLMLTLNPKTVIVPKTGQTQLVWVVGVEFRGSMDLLQQIGYERAKADALHAARIEQIEEEARRLLTYDPVRLADPEEVDEFVEEFVPEQAAKEVRDGDSQKAQQINEGEQRHAERGQMAGADGAGSAGPGPGDRDATEGAGSDPTPTGAEAGRVRAAPRDPAPAAPNGKPTRRSRRNKFDVDPGEWNGVTQLQTCGATPEQIMEIRKIIGADDEAKAVVSSFLAGIGYDRLSYLREDEAEQLLSQIRPVDVEPVQEEGGDGDEPTVVCPINGGDRMKKSYCLSGCLTRKRDGFCPVLGETPQVEAI